MISFLFSSPTQCYNMEWLQKLLNFEMGTHWLRPISKINYLLFFVVPFLCVMYVKHGINHFRFHGIMKPFRFCCFRYVLMRVRDFDFEECLGLLTVKPLGLFILFIQ